MSRTLFAQLLILLSIVINVQDSAAELHGLLIGINHDQYDKAVLPGPENDVTAIKQTLVAQYGAKPTNIQTLCTKQATKQAILDGIDKLHKVSRKGDQIFLYYSGHGTSPYDEKAGMTLDLPYTSGALFPYDSKVNKPGGATIAEIRNSLIIGKEDLRPRIKQLEQDRLVLAVFDACFSANAIRSAAFSVDHSLRRYQPTHYDLTKIKINFRPALKEPYPYDNVFFISASSEFESAYDLTPKYGTVDDKAHGLMTDQFLRVLGSPEIADRNNDGQMNLGELFKTIKDMTVRKSGWCAEKTDRIKVFTPHSLPENSPLQAKQFFTVKTDSQVSNTPTTSVVAGISHSIINKTYPKQRFNVTVDMPDVHGDRVKIGDEISFSLFSEKKAYLLLLNVDSQGMVHVIYPYTDNELEAVSANETISLPEMGAVTMPPGREHLKLVGFKNKPEGYEWLRGRESIRPGSEEYRKLEEILAINGNKAVARANSGTIAQNTTNLITVEL